MASAAGAGAAFPGRDGRPRLLQQLRSVLRARHYSRATERAYVRWGRRLVRFHGMRHPAELGPAEITAFLTDLAERGRISQSTQTQALSGILFLYRSVLQQDFGWLDGLVRAKAPERLPAVLTRDEVGAVLDLMRGTSRIAAELLYGSGLRLMEMPYAPGQGRRVREGPAHGEAGQGCQGPGNDAAEGGAAGVAEASRGW